MKTQIRSRYDDHSEQQKLSQTPHVEFSNVQQQFKEESDINNILNKYKDTGTLPQTSQQGAYGDYSKIPDYHSALNLIIQAQNSFNDLSPQIRSKFQNDPQQLINYLNNPNLDQDEASSLGLIPKPIKTAVSTLTDVKPTVVQTPVI